MKVNAAVLAALKGAVEQCDSAEALQALVGGFAEEIKTELKDAIDAKTASLTKGNILVKDAGLAEILEARPELVQHVLATHKDSAAGTAATPDEKDAEIARLKTELEQANAKVTDLTQQLEAAGAKDAEIETLKAELETAKARITELEGAQTATTAAGETAKQDAEALLATLRETATQLKIDGANAMDAAQLATALATNAGVRPTSQGRRHTPSKFEGACQDFATRL
jgi:chromosome segregation ATPase